MIVRPVQLRANADDAVFMIGQAKASSQRHEELRMPVAILPDIDRAHPERTQTIAGTDDWRVAFNDISSRPAFREFTSARTLDTTAQFQTFTGAVTAVPEPETVALMAVGLAAVAAWRRRKTR